MDKEYISSRLVLALAEPQYDEAPDKFAQKILQVLEPTTCGALPQSWQNIKTLADVHHWLRTQLNDAQLFTVTHCHNRALLGLAVVHEQGDEAYVGYVIAKQYWGRGFGSEALKALVAQYKEQNSITTLWAGVEKDNISSIKVLTKSGFSLSEGGHRDSNTLHYRLLLSN
ncbi:GNAT family N-acetyltransferase [Pseudoalteromonas sp. MMG022]|uniref:GNAT family N-acetyltransferase n=1 Tax=Pseudoalteromonas sp. MMG022 TaxID=2909978 RepID=UPI001F3CAAC5|nr:GNAT family N-acetyltransferase [Pseudoalteromonas sp. MMG022]MCF6433953.1 GNAT family N-acetyltransferase [Pseudoalteromonas sp. MMG022]